jgi:hypothetical protein
MKLSLLFVSTLLYLFSSLTIAETKIYRWIDENGKIHFSDTAVPGTEQLDMKEINLVPVNTQQSDSIAKELSLDEEEQEVIEYHATITSPEDDTALRSNEGTINIHVAIEPEKDNSHTLQLYLDGIKLGSPQISPAIRAQNIDRGTHQVQVELLDENGKGLAKTQVVTVHLQRASIKQRVNIN